jgi:hypothetical protein
VPSVSTGTGLSGTIGGFIRSMGDRSISSSSSSHFMNCCSARWVTFAVEADRVSTRCPM